MINEAQIDQALEFLNRWHDNYEDRIRGCAENKGGNLPYNRRSRDQYLNAINVIVALRTKKDRNE